MQKETNIATTDRKRELRPRRSFSGKPMRKSRARFRELKMERNAMIEMMEKQSPIREAIANALNAGWPSSGALPSSLVPPGTVLAVANATPATIPATAEQDVDVSLSPSMLSLISSLCDSSKISAEVLPNLLRLR